MKIYGVFLAGFCALLLAGIAHAVEKTKVQPGYIQPAKELTQEAVGATEQQPAADQEASEEPSTFYPEDYSGGEGSNPYSAADSTTGNTDPVPPTGEIAIPAPIPDDPTKEDPP